MLIFFYLKKCKYLPENFKKLHFLHFAHVYTTLLISWEFFGAMVHKKKNYRKNASFSVPNYGWCISSLQWSDLEEGGPDGVEGPCPAEACVAQPVQKDQGRRVLSARLIHGLKGL